MAPSSFGKQTAGCESPHDWLMSLAMDLAALCDTRGGENVTNGSHFPVLSEDVAFACTHPPPPCRSATGIGYACKKYLKWQEIQLAIQCTEDNMSYVE